jgi:hypothetical protein
MSEKEIGKVTHYFARLNVAVLSLTDTLTVGDRIRIHGRSTDLEQTVDSMQIEHKAVPQVGPGQEVALRVIERVREGDLVYRVTSNG